MRLAQKDRQAREAGPFPPTLGEGEGTATRRLPGVPCDISIGSSRIPLDNICVKRQRWRVITTQIEEKPEPKSVK